MKLCLTTQTLRQSLLLLVSLAFLAPDSRADTYVSGPISGGTWTQDAAPFLVTNDVYISGSLNIKEGVEVRFLSNWVFEVGGKLRAFGSAAAPVVFQPADTNVGWQGLLFRDAVPGSFFVYTTIQGSKNSGVRITNTATKDTVTVFVDAATGELGAKRYMGTLTGAPGELTEVYSDYQSIDGVRLPAKTVMMMGGQAAAESNTSGVKLNPGLADSIFAKPAQ